MPTDLAEFEVFFKRMGVCYDKGGLLRYAGGTVLSVAQAYFHFDAQGRYRGVESDTMSYFDPRETPLPGAQL